MATLLQLCMIHAMSQILREKNNQKNPMLVECLLYGNNLQPFTFPPESLIVWKTSD